MIVRNYIKDYLAVKLGHNERAVWPLLASFYITHRCNFHCSYCSDGKGQPFYLNPVEELKTREVYALLDNIRPAVDILDITGGEPLLRDDLAEILLYARKLKFKKIILNTNGCLIRRKQDLLELVDLTYVSLDSLKPEKLAGLYSIAEEEASSHLSDIVWLGQVKHKSEIAISAVLLPENLNEVGDLLEFCRKYGFGFTASPALKGIIPVTGLDGSAEYKRSIEAIIKAKKKGAKIIGSTAYYEVISNFAQFQCYPLLMPTIDPAGNLYLPCLELGQKKIPLTSYRDLQEAIANSWPDMYYPPDCKKVCHILCHAGLSVLLQGLSVPLSETVFACKQRFQTPRRWHGF